MQYYCAVIVHSIPHRYDEQCYILGGAKLGRACGFSSSSGKQRQDHR